MFPPPAAEPPRIDRTTMVAVDRSAIEEYGVDLIQMMENAGRALAEVTRRRFLDGDPRGRTVVVMAGTGGNGGGGLVAARRLHGWGANVAVLATRSDSGFDGVPAHQLESLRSIGVPVELDPVHLPAPDVVLDALIGYSLQGSPEGAAAGAIRWSAAVGAPVIALDVPTGIDVTTGQAHPPAVRAAATVTLALPKVGLDAATHHVGELYLADLGIPPEVYRGLRIEVGPWFASGDVVRLG